MLIFYKERTHNCDCTFKFHIYHALFILDLDLYTLLFQNSNTTSYSYNF